jgi:hypothetical protein
MKIIGTIITVYIVIALSFSPFGIAIAPSDLNEAHNDETLNDLAEEKNIDSRSAARVNLIEQNEHGGSWLDSFDDLSGIDLAQTDKIDAGTGKAVLNDLGTQKVFEDTFSTPLDTAKWINNTGGGTTLYTYPFLKAVKSGQAQTFDAYIETRQSFHYQRTVEWLWNSYFDSSSVGFSHAIDLFNGDSVRLIVYIRQDRSFAIQEINPFASPVLYDSSPTKINSNEWYKMKMQITKDLSVFEIRDMGDNLLINKDVYPSIFPTEETGSVRFIFAGKSGASGYSFDTRADNLTIRSKKYESIGNLTSTTIDLPEGMKWDTLILNKTEPKETSLNVTILNSTSNLPITGYDDLTLDGEQDISNLNMLNEKSIKLRARFTGPSQTPKLNYWGVCWNASNAWRDTFFSGTRVSTVQSTKDIEHGDGKAWKSIVPGEMQVDGNTAALWHCDENTGTRINDETTNNNDGILGGDGSGGDLPMWVEGRFGSGLYFDGTDDFISVSDRPSLSITGKITIEVWLNFSALPTSSQYFPIIKKRVFGSDSYQLNIDSAGRPRFLVDCGGSGNVIAGNFGINDGKWHYIAATWDQTNLRLYVDGTSVANAIPLPGSMADTPDYLGIGFHTYDSAAVFDYYQGFMDEIRISNKARPASEIQDIYKGLPNKDPGFLFSKSINLPYGCYYDKLKATITQPSNTYLNLTVINAQSGVPINGFVGRTDMTIDMSSIDPFTYSSVMLKATFKSDSLESAVLHDWSVNWTVNTAPYVSEILPESTEAYRTFSTTLEINAVDNKRPVSYLSLDLKYQPPGTTLWQDAFISDVHYENGKWLADFTPTASAKLGLYRFRIACTDEFDAQSTEVFEDVVEVKNNLPTTPELEIIPKEPKTRDDLEVKAYNSTDIEDELVTYNYKWYKNNALQKDLLSSTVDSDLTSKGEEWRVLVTPNDGNTNGNGTPNSTSITILNSPPIVKVPIGMVIMEEDGINDKTINLYTTFNDYDLDKLIFSCVGQDKIEVAIDQDTGKVTLAPEANWFGQETLVFSADDTEEGADDTVTVIVHSQNDPPRLIKAGSAEVQSPEQILNFTVHEESVISLTFIAEDVDGDKVTFSTNRTDNVGIDDIVEINLDQNILLFKPGNEHVGIIPINLSLSDSNGSIVYYEIELNILNKNNPPFVEIVYPSNGTHFKESDKISFKCTYSDPDISVRNYNESLYFTWSSNAVIEPIGDGEFLADLTGIKLKSGIHEITVTVRDKDGLTSSDSITIIIDKAEEDGAILSDLSDLSSSLFWIILIIIIVVIILITIFIMKRKKTDKPEAELPPPAVEESEVLQGAIVTKPGALAGPTIDMEDLSAPVQVEHLPATAGAEIPPQTAPTGTGDVYDVSVEPSGVVQIPAQSQPREVVPEHLPPGEPEPYEEEGEFEVPDFSIEGGPKPVQKDAVDHDASNEQVVYDFDFDKATADLKGAGTVEIEEEEALESEREQELWNLDDKGEADLPDEVKQQLEKLSELKDRGLLTEDEYQQKKVELLR